LNILSEYENSSLILTINEDQELLCSNFVIPYLERIELIGLEFRKDFDSIIINKVTPSKRYLKPFEIFTKKSNLSLTKQYPIGGCYPISHAFLHFILYSPKFEFLNEFKQRGGIIKLVWGNIRNEFFQTAIQIGNYIVDVSNDTVDVKMAKVKLSKIGTIDFKNFTSIEEFISVKEKYHETTVYVNDLVPEIADFYPLISKKKNTIQFIDNKALPYLILKLKCKLPASNQKLDSVDSQKIISFFNTKALKKINEISNLNEKQKAIRKMALLFNKFVALK
jgi:hypothetical protein